MKIIDFRFRPNTKAIIDGIRNSAMFRASCEVIGFDKRKVQPLPEIVADLDKLGVEIGVITGRDAETTYGFPSNNPDVLEFCKTYPESLTASGVLIPTKRWPLCVKQNMRYAT